jgi:hypothetical protein
MLFWKRGNILICEKRETARRCVECVRRDHASPPQFHAYGEIAVMKADGSDLRVLTDDSIEQGTPVWISRREV